MQRIAVLEGVLQLAQALQLGRALDGLDLLALRLNREQEAPAHHATVEHHGARAADAMLTADMRAGQSQIGTEEIDQVHARRHGPPNR